MYCFTYIKQPVRAPHARRHSHARTARTHRTHARTHARTERTHARARVRMGACIWPHHTLTHVTRNHNRNRDFGENACRQILKFTLSDLDHAIETQDAVNKPNLKIMFDCYHIQVMQGNLLTRLKENLPRIGHIQFANCPGRNEPDSGEINFPWLFAEIDSIGWEGYLGAEYISKTSTEESLGWIRNYL